MRRLHRQVRFVPKPEDTVTAADFDFTPESGHHGMSEKFRPEVRGCLFYHLVGARKQRGRQSEAERLGRLKIDQQF